MKKYGLIGQSLAHSFSKPYFTEKFAEIRIDASYENYEVDALESLEWLLEQDISGCNVTMPYKKKAAELVDEVDPVAEAVGAINTIKRVGSKLIGYNTDVVGFEQSILETGLLSQIHQRALILGSGGAAQAVSFVLRKLGFSYAIVSRTSGDFVYEDIDASVMSSVGLVVNTTPLGNKDNLAAFPPLPYHFFDEKHLAYDLIYNPEKTVFLEKAEAQGASIANGLRMLVLQAEASWEIWNS